MKSLNIAIDRLDLKLVGVLTNIWRRSDKNAQSDAISDWLSLVQTGLMQSRLKATTSKVGVMGMSGVEGYNEYVSGVEIIYELSRLGKLFCDVCVAAEHITHPS